MSLRFSEINYLAVVAVALATFFLGAVWYTVLFGKLWVRLHGYSEEKVKEMQAKMSPPIFFGGMLGIVLAYWRRAYIKNEGTMKRTFSVGLGLILVSYAFANETPVMSEAVIPASLDEVWHAWTTSEGLQAWLAPHVQFDLRIGGKMLSNYDAKGKLGDAKTIENTILSYDPKRMLSIRATKPPQGFPFPNAIKNAWTVLYFEKAGPAATKVTISMLGYTRDEESQKMRKHFEWGNDFTLKKLQKHFEARKPAR